MTDPIAALEHVDRRFDTIAGSLAAHPLRDVSLAVAPGESVAIVGPSGSGKSTLLQILGGLLPPSSGTARVAGEDLASLDEDALARLRNEKIGFVFQQHHLLPQCTVLENVLLPTLARRGRASDEQVARARELIDQVGLGARLHHRPAQLSGGECQRVAVARALILEPVLLLADEPTGALDTETATALGDLLVSMQRDHGVAVVLVTHWPPLAARMDRTLVLRDGGLVEAAAAAGPGGSGGAG